MIYRNLLVPQRECLGFGLLVEAPPDAGCVETEASPQLGQTLRLTSRRRASELVFKMGAPACSCGAHRDTCAYAHAHSHIHAYEYAHEYTHMHMCTHGHMCTHMHT